MAIRQIRCAFAVLLIALATLATPSIASAQEAGAPTVLVTGSNRGIGFEFVKQYAAADWFVIATCRTPEKADELNALAADNPFIVVEELDITDPDEIAALAAKYEGEPVDLLLNNAGYLGTNEGQDFGRVDYDMAAQMFAVNALGALRMSEAFVDHVARSSEKKIVAITSLSGSTGSMRDSKLISYRASKAALNSVMHNLSLALAGQGISVGILAPGVVDTMGLLDMKDDEIPDELRPLVEGVKKGVFNMQRASDSIAAMRLVIENLSPENSGVFFDYDGSTLPW